MIPAWSDARKMVRRQASKLADDTEDSEKSQSESPGLQAKRASQSSASPVITPVPRSGSPTQVHSSLLAHPHFLPQPNGALYGATAETKTVDADSLPPPAYPAARASSPLLPKAADERHVVIRSRPHSPPSKRPSPQFTLYSDLVTWYGQLRSSPYLSALLFCIPVGLLSSLLQLPEALTFVFNFLSIIPLAWMLGMITEEVALRTTQTLGALLNATFGNAVELIVSVVALRKGFISLVQKSLLGSVLSNLLLVLGTSFLLGGLRYDHQIYNRKGAQIFASMLLLACLAVAVPSAYVNAFTAEVAVADVLDISRVTAVIIFSIYVLYLYFQLFTHTQMFSDAEGEDDDDDDEDDEVPLISLSSALFLLFVITLLISLCSDALIDSIEPVTRAWSINESFIGIILLPIVGNAAEHATAVTCALKNKLDLSIGVAIGSSTQIALFVIPFVTLLGWAIDQPMTLGFSEFELVVLVMSVLIVNFLVKDGESNWLLGAMLVASYAILATAFFFHPTDASENVSTITTALHKVQLGGDPAAAASPR